MAILEATVQVLLELGFGRLTTTRVADRAGVSVGTLYQYFPNKQALILSVFERHVDAVACWVEAACQAQHGRDLASMVQALVGSFIAAKLRRRDVALALRHATAELGAEAIVRQRAQRTRQVMVEMFATAIDAPPERLALAADVLASAILGVVDGTLAAADDHQAALQVVQHELVLMGTAYLRQRGGVRASGRAAP